MQERRQALETEQAELQQELEALRDEIRQQKAELSGLEEVHGHHSRGVAAASTADTAESPPHADSGAARQRDDVVRTVEDEYLDRARRFLESEAQRPEYTALEAATERKRHALVASLASADPRDDALLLRMQVCCLEKTGSCASCQVTC